MVMLGTAAIYCGIAEIALSAMLTRYKTRRLKESFEENRILLMQMLVLGISLNFLGILYGIVPHDLSGEGPSLSSAFGLGVLVTQAVLGFAIAFVSIKAVMTSGTKDKPSLAFYIANICLGVIVIFIAFRGFLMR